MFRKGEGRALPFSLVTGYGILPLRVGNYSITVTGKNYESYVQPVLAVSQNEAVAFQPTLEYTRDYEYELFNERITEMERSIQYGLRPTNTDIRAMQELKASITQSKHSFPLLLARVEKLIDWARTTIGEGSLVEPESEKDTAAKEQRLKALLAQKQGLELQLATTQLKRKRRTVGGFISFGLSMASAGAAGILYFAANDA